MYTYFIEFLNFFTIASSTLHHIAVKSASTNKTRCITSEHDLP
jgi:hypothetical protein